MAYDEIMETLKKKWDTASMVKSSEAIEAILNTCEFELGYEVINVIKEHIKETKENDCTKDEIIILHISGIPVRINKKNPWVIKLWKEA